MSGLNVTLEPALEGCIDSCCQCIGIAANLTTSQFVLAPEGFSSGGAHLRHCLDHFEALLDGWPARLVDYDARRRDPRIERDPLAFIKRMEFVVESLRSLSVTDTSSSLRIIQAPSISSTGACMSSTLERELVFLSSHCIHHLAIVRLMLSYAGIEIPREIGIAWSTARWEATHKAATAGFKR